MVEVANTNSQALSGLALLLPQAPEAVQQQFISLVAARLQQHSEDIEGTVDEIARVEALIPTIDEHLTAQQVQQVLDAIPEIPQRIRVIHPDGTELDPNSFLDVQAALSAQTVVAILEAQRTTEGYVSQATLQLADGTSKTITFNRDSVDGVATYVGQMADGAGGLANAFEFKLSIAHLSNEFLGLDMSYDSADVREMRTFITGFSYEIRALNSGGGSGPTTPSDGPRLIPEEESGNYTQTSGASRITNGEEVSDSGYYAVSVVYGQTAPDQVVNLLVNGEQFLTVSEPGVGTKGKSILFYLPAGTTLFWEPATPSTTSIQQVSLSTYEIQTEPDSL